MIGLGMKRECRRSPQPNPFRHASLFTLYHRMLQWWLASLARMAEMLCIRPRLAAFQDEVRFNKRLEWYR